MTDTVLVINQNDAQTQIVLRMLRAEQINAWLMPGNVTLEEIISCAPHGLIVSGGSSGHPESSFDENWLRADLPMLALGDSALALLTHLGGKARGEPLSTGVHALTRYDCPLLRDLNDNERYLRNVLPLELSGLLCPSVAVREDCIGFHHQNLPLYGLQLHVESNDPDAARILTLFALEVCRCSRRWSSDTIISDGIALIRGKVGEGVALCELTGGVDSGVCALLGHMALSAKLSCYFVDSGLLRERIREETLSLFGEKLGLDIQVVEAGERFQSALAGIVSPHEKTSVIRQLLHQIRTEQAERANARVIFSSMNASDLISGEAVYGNLGAAPIAQLFKDEVRRLGEVLGLPPALCGKQPFPATGLALRIKGEVTPERLSMLRHADAIWSDEAEKAGQAHRIWRHFPMLLPVDGGCLICLRAVNTVEYAGAQPARLPYELPEAAANRIISEVHGVTRVMYDFTPVSSRTELEWD
jgi:GMP synthase (glutamine-hydrolysing)